MSRGITTAMLAIASRGQPFTKRLFTDLTALRLLLMGQTGVMDPLPLVRYTEKNITSSPVIFLTVQNAYLNLILQHQVNLSSGTLYQITGQKYQGQKTRERPRNRSKLKETEGHAN